MYKFHSHSLEESSTNIRFTVDTSNKDDTILRLFWIHTPTEVMNALRRSIFNTTTMRIEDIYIYPENSVHPYNFDHQIGSIPIENYNPNDFIFPYELDENYSQNAWKCSYVSDHQLTEKKGSGIVNRPDRPKHCSFYEVLPNDPDERFVLRFDLDVTCEMDINTGEMSHHLVFGKDIKWTPIGNQAIYLYKNDPTKYPRLKPDVLIAQLSCGQRLKYTFYAWKGNAQEYAKWRGVNIIINPTGYQTYTMTIKSLDGLPPQYFLSSALKTLSMQCKQMYQDCLIKHY